MSSVIVKICLVLALIFTACSDKTPNNTALTDFLNDTNESNTTHSLCMLITKLELSEEASTPIEVRLTDEHNNSSDITSHVTWSYFKPLHVKIEKNRLTALKEGDTYIKARYQNLTSNALHVNIYKEINGHRLPPEPDPKINNATIEGIDSNDNGVRDDVERKIYLHYEKEISRQMVMQEAKTLQSRLAAPDLIENAKEWEKLDRYIMGCLSHLYRKYDINLFRKSAFMKEATLNTKDRARKYLKYNYALSGGTYGTSDIFVTEQSCEFNISTAVEKSK